MYNYQSRHQKKDDSQQFYKVASIYANLPAEKSKEIDALIKQSFSKEPKETKPASSKGYSTNQSKSVKRDASHT